MSGKPFMTSCWDSTLVHSGMNGSALINIEFASLLQRSLRHRKLLRTSIGWRKPCVSLQSLSNTDIMCRLRRKSVISGVDGNWRSCCQNSVTTLDDNCNEFGITEFNMKAYRQGIVTLLGQSKRDASRMTVFVVILHTFHNTELGALAHVLEHRSGKHVLATQCLVTKKSRIWLVRVEMAKLVAWVSAKDVVLAIIGAIVPRANRFTDWIWRYGHSVLSMEWPYDGL